jgi:tRNA threonylcarbamoyladenosine modification (KEOPS) complex  Pcc1 subunit
MDGDDSSDAETLPAQPKPFQCVTRVPCSSSRIAQLLLNVLDVDKEIAPDKITRTMRVEGSELVVTIEASEARLLRASMASFFDMAMVAMRTLCEFDA